MNSPLTIVTGYWSIHNKHGKAFKNWLPVTLKIDHPFVFFTSKYELNKLKSYRKNLPTEFIVKDIGEFESHIFYNRIKTHSTHQPSIELGLIWHEKIFLLKESLQRNLYNSDWFLWYDAGHCLMRPPKSKFRYLIPSRTKKPSKVCLDALKDLPPDKFCFSTSCSDFSITSCQKYLYYHYIAGTSYFIHKSMINIFSKLYHKYLDILLDIECVGGVWIDQCVWTHIYKDHPELFYKIGNGYGDDLNLILSGDSD